MSDTDNLNQSTATQPYPSYNSTSPPGTIVPSEPAAPYPPPSTTTPYPPPATTDPAYPPPATAPPAVNNDQTEKTADLPPYSEPPPSYQASNPASGMPQQPTQNPGHPPTTYQYAPPTTQTVIRTIGALPQNMECPHCHQQVQTDTRFAPGLLTYIVVGTCLLFGGWFGCCLIPFCIDGLKDVYHTCPNCKNLIGRYDRLS